jgi:FAD/FMN-containing dehydrogenase
MVAVAKDAAAAASEHDRRVAEIAARVREALAAGGPVHISKGGVHHVVPIPGDSRFATRPIDISSLHHILSIDVANRRCVAEPGVTFADLVRATLPHGLIPTVVPELEGITVGGAVAGCSVEAMSYKYGGFHDSCLEYEIVTGAGDVQTLTPERDAEAFHMIHGSYGTLAILTRLTFKLVPAKKLVRMEYRTFDSFAAFDAEMRARMAAADFEFIDGIVHGPRQLVLCLGRFVDAAPYVSSYRWLDIFYKSTAKKTEDYLTTFDYCFRYDTECHWLTRTVPPLEWKPVRFLVGKIFLGSTNLIKWSNRLAPVLKRAKKRPDVVVDVFIPGKRFADFFEWYAREFDYWPLWIVPYRVPTPYPWISPAHQKRMDDDLFIDCAIYGKKNAAPEVDASKQLEDKTYELGGIKTLISRNHYTRERFWDVYDQARYDRVKGKLDPRGVFKNLYDKFSRV